VGPSSCPMEATSLPPPRAFRLKMPPAAAPGHLQALSVEKRRLRSRVFCRRQLRKISRCPASAPLRFLMVKFVLNALTSPHTARADDHSVRSRSSLRDIQESRRPRSSATHSFMACAARTPTMQGAPFARKIARLARRCPKQALAAQRALSHVCSIGWLQCSPTTSCKAYSIPFRTRW
jgi:hypothetical protein